MLNAKLKQFVREHENDDIHSLALQAKRHPGIDMSLAIRQISGRQTIKTKIPAWYKYEDLLYPKHLSLEQSSSEATARYKAKLCDGQTLADITGGMGIDFYFMSQKFREATYVEQQEELAELALHNFKVLGLNNCVVINGDSTEFLESMPPVDWLYIDPARRNQNGRKVSLIEDCSPDIGSLEPLIRQKSSKTMIKLSPMLDIATGIRTLKNISDVHIVSVQNECKELIFIKDNSTGENDISAMLHCVNMEKDRTDILTFDRKSEDKLTVDYTPTLKKYLYEPNASVLKAGAFKSITVEFPASKLHPNSHLYTSDRFYPGYHGRVFLIEHVCTFNKNDIKNLSIKQANVSTRNFPLSVDELRKRLRIKDGGELYLFATTLADNKKVLIICRKA